MAAPFGGHLRYSCKVSLAVYIVFFHFFLDKKGEEKIHGVGGTNDFVGCLYGESLRTVDNAGIGIVSL